MKKLLLILLFITTFIKADGVNAYNEYKVDLYYANGIMMQESEAQSKVTWQERVDDLLFENPHLRERIGKTDVAYNISEGMIHDLWEAFMQKVNLEPEYGVGWSAFKVTISRMGQIGKVADFVINASEYASSISHDGTLNEQVENYKQSIELGHGVVVVAHSQGNLFTAEAF